MCKWIVAGTGLECSHLGKPEYKGYCTRHCHGPERDARAAAAAAAEAARAAAAAEAERARRVAKNEDLLARCPNLTTSEYQTLSEDLAQFWTDIRFPGFAAIVAYKALRHSPIQDPRLPAILRATLQLLFLTSKYHPTKRGYMATPKADRVLARDQLKEAVAPLQPLAMTAEFLPASDPLRRKLEERIRQEEAAAAAAAAAEAEMDRRLREEPVVFVRDPEGSVNLRAFATDAQNVHRSSVQSATERSVRLLLERDVPAAQNALDDIVGWFNDAKIIKWNRVSAKEQVLHELANDVLETMAFSVRYKDVLDRVCCFVQRHRYKKELGLRLAQEIEDGSDQCSNGKMARLVNVLQGYDETLFVPQTPPKEAFQEMMARLRGRPIEERGPAAAALFEEYSIAEGERGAWLEALAE